ncbi:lantibiotic dehydratase C-terminal domain-containing protein [Tumebacillus algifaecis]|uniref:lantibiotic dehydratase C-terminal domain-containing protein n=1 Tax=Tumebacillus algifaecis TaxID=1214604 RepID=UPI0012FD1862|nr:lantibiotic dehydratase C-terminal domain-containing protein [Tumebacillus algifaecis]
MWQAIHVYYYEDQKEALLLDAIRPLLQELRTKFGVERLHLRRHWKFGPHVVLQMEADHDRFTDSILPYVREALAPYLQAHPSLRTLDPAQYIQLSKTLGAWELEAGPYEPLQADNTVVELPFVRRSEVVNGVNVMTAIENFWVKALDAVLDIMEDSRGDTLKRYLWMIKMMAAVAEQFPSDGILRGHLSYRSHVEGFLKQMDQKGQLLAAYKQQEEQLGGIVEETLRDVLSKMDANGVYIGEERPLRIWSESLRDLFQECYTMAKDGKLTSSTDHYKDLAERIGQEAVDRWKMDDPEAGMSDFHKTLFAKQGNEQFFQSPEFATYRMLINVFYTYLPLFGINPNYKHLLCYLLCGAVERVKGITWQELVKGFGQSGGEGVPDEHEAKV